MRGLVLALIAFALCAVAVAKPGTGCEKYTAAYNMVEDIVASGAPLLKSVTTEAGLDQGVRFLYEASVKADRGHNVNLLFGTKDGDFYQLWNCWAPEHYKYNLTGPITGDFRTYCQSAGASQYIVVVRNDKVFPSSNTYAYSVGADGFRKTLLAERSSESSVRKEPWYTQTDKTWSADYTFADGTVGSTYSASILSATSAHEAQVASSWTAAENPSCADPCLENAVAKIAVDAFTPTFLQLNSGGAPTSANVLSAMFKTMTESDNGYSSFMYVATTGGNFYGIEDCYRAGIFSAHCLSAGVSQRYLAYVREGATARKIYKYSEIGIGADLQVTDTSGEPTAQKWYQSATATGAWTVGASTPRVDSYSKQAIDSTGTLIGVVGADRGTDEPCFNGCKINSAAFKATNAIGGDVASFASAPQSLAEAKAILKNLAMKFVGTNQGYAEVLFFFTPQVAEWYEITPCNSIASMLTSYCSLTDLPYLGQIKSNLVFGDNRRRVFGITASGGVMEEIAVDTLDFDVTTYVFYKPLGLSAVYSLAQVAGDASATTFSRKVYSGVSEVGTVGSAIMSAAPCSNGCLTNSYAVKLSRNVGGLATFAASSEIQTTNDIHAFIKQIHTQAEVTEQGYTLGVRVMYPSGDYYEVLNCFSENYVNAWCRAAGSGTKYIAVVRAARVYGTYLQYFKLYSDGTFGEKIASGNEAFDASTLDSYAKEGWTGITTPDRLEYVLPVYKQAGSGVELVGVVAADKPLSESCLPACQFNSYAPKVGYYLSHGSMNVHVPATTNSSVTSILTSLISALTMFDYGSNVGVVFSPFNGDYYEIMDCHAAENRLNKHCVNAGPSTRYVSFIKNQIVFTSARFHVYTTTEAGMRMDYLGYEDSVDAMITAASQVGFGILYSASGNRFVTKIFDAANAVTELGYVQVKMSTNEPCYDKCKVNSFAPGAVSQFAASEEDGGMSPVRFAGITDWPTVELALENLYNGMRMNDNGHNVMLFVGYANSDFYGVKNCRISAALLSDERCQVAVKQGLQHIAYVRNTAIYGDDFRRVYGISIAKNFALQLPAIGDALPTPIDTLNQAYPTTERAWYKLKSGWTALYDFASGAQGTTFAKPVLSASGDIIAVVAADKYSAEPCYGMCKRHSYAVPAVQTLVTNGDLGRFREQTDSQVTIAAAIQQIWHAYEANDQGTNELLYFANNVGDYYAVKNCRSAAASGNDPFCANRATTARLLALVKNKAAYGDDLLHVYQISETGQLSDFVAVSESDFDPLTQPWFETKDGWTFAKTYGAYPAPEHFTLSIPFNKTVSTNVGVAGALRNSAEPCSDACLESSYAVKATHSFTVQNVGFISSMNQYADIARAVQLLWDSFKQSDHGDNAELMYVTTNNDFLSILNCWLPANYGNAYCEQAGRDVWTIAVVKSPLAHASMPYPSRAHVYKLTTTGAIDSLIDTFATTENYRTREWYIRRSGWGSLYDLGGGQVGRTYAVPVDAIDATGKATNLGIVAALRTSSEECFSGADQDVPSTRVRVMTLDTIKGIAQSYGYDWHSFLLLNRNLQNPNDLKPKQYLYHSLLYVVNEGDTLYSIALKYGISWTELLALNPQIAQTKSKLEWQERPSNDPAGRTYFYNLRTKEAQWDKPKEVVEAEKTDLKIYKGQKLAVRPNLKKLVCQNEYYTINAASTV